MSPPFNHDISPAQEASSGQYLYRQLFVTPPLVAPQKVNLSGQTAIVTGSNIGLGLECARQLLDLNLSKLIIAVRTLSKGEAARTRLLAGRDIDSTSIEVWPLDLTSYAAVVEFAKRAESLERLDIAVMNAGVYKVNRALDPNTGFDEDVQVNLLSTALLAILLLPIIKAKHSPSKPGRIIIISSDTAAWARFEERTANPILPAFKDTAGEWDMEERYGSSKLLRQLCIPELSERIGSKDVIVKTCNPGFCYGSGLQREGEGTWLDFAVGVITRIIGRSTSVGARTLTAAVVKFGSDVHGQYVEDRRIRPMAPLIYTSEGGQIADRLWDELTDELAFIGARSLISGMEHQAEG